MNGRRIWVQKFEVSMRYGLRTRSGEPRMNNVVSMKNGRKILVLMIEPSRTYWAEKMNSQTI